MLSHIVRWIAATLNSLLGGLLTACWVGSAFGGMTDDWIGWLALLSLVTATIASAGAGIFLIRRRTTALGLQWHSIVTWCLLTFFVAIVLETAHQAVKHDYPVSWSPLLAVLTVISIWPVLGFILKTLSCGKGVAVAFPVQRLQRRRKVNGGKVVAQPLATVSLPPHVQQEKARILQNRL